MEICPKEQPIGRFIKARRTHRVDVRRFEEIDDRATGDDAAIAIAFTERSTERRLTTAARNVPEVRRPDRVGISSVLGTIIGNQAIARVLPTEGSEAGLKAIDEFVQPVDVQSAD